MEEKEYLYCVDKENEVYRVLVERDESTYDVNPREEFENLGTMICNHRKYNLGDIQDDFYDFMNKEVGTDEDLSDSELFKKWKDSKYMVLPLNLYDHSGLSMSIGFGRGWDNGVVGYIFVDKDNKELLDYQKTHSEDETKNWVSENLQSEVKTYDNYLCGDIYYAKSEKFDKGTREWTDFDSVGGIFPNNDLNYYEQKEEIARNVVNPQKFITKNEAEKLLDKNLPQNEKAVFDKFISDVNCVLPDFENHYGHSLVFVKKTMQKEGKENHFSLISDFLKKVGCIDEKTTEIYLKEKSNLPNVSKTANKIFYGWDKANGNDTGTLFVDESNKRFGILGSQIASSSILKNAKKIGKNEIVKIANALTLDGFTESDVGYGSINLSKITKNSEVKEKIKQINKFKSDFIKKEKEIENKTLENPKKKIEIGMER